MGWLCFKSRGAKRANPLPPQSRGGGGCFLRSLSSYRSSYSFSNVFSLIVILLSPLAQIFLMRNIKRPASALAEMFCFVLQGADGRFKTGIGSGQIHALLAGKGGGRNVRTKEKLA